MLSFVDTTHPSAAPGPRSARSAHWRKPRLDVSTPLVALEAAGALYVRVRGCAGEGALEGWGLSAADWTRCARMYCRA